MAKMLHPEMCDDEARLRLWVTAHFCKCNMFLMYCIWKGLSDLCIPLKGIFYKFDQNPRNMLMDLPAFF